jgi:putative ABC transport system substrate-binding protein
MHAPVLVYMTCIVLLVGSVPLGGTAHAVEHARPIRIGALTSSWGPTPEIVGLREGLLELGYREDKDFVLGVRFTQGDIAALPAAARQLVENGVDLILAHDNLTAKAVQMATNQIPIVFAAVEDPVGAKLVQSFARPGGNITGVATLDIELGPKRLQVFQEIVAKLKRVLFLYGAMDVYAEAAAKVYRAAAHRLGIVLVEQAVRTKKEILTVLSQVRQRKVDGLLSPRCCTLNIPGFILEAATQQRIPTMFMNGAFWVERGALATYGPDFYETGRQAARLVDKILKGADPATLPVEMNSKIEFAINLKTAKALGLTIAPEMLYRADLLVR